MGVALTFAESVDTVAMLLHGFDELGWVAIVGFRIGSVLELSAREYQWGSAHTTGAALRAFCGRSWRCGKNVGYYHTRRVRPHCLLQCRKIS